MMKQYYVIHIVTTLEHPPYRPTCHRMSFVPLSQIDKPSFNNAKGNMTNAVLQLRVRRMDTRNVSNSCTGKSVVFRKVNILKKMQCKWDSLNVMG